MIQVRNLSFSYTKKPFILKVDKTPASIGGE